MLLLLIEVTRFIDRWTDRILALGEDAAEYGYPAIAFVVAADGIFPAFPGEGVIIAGAVIAAGGGLNLYLVIAAGAVGAVIGDSTAYWVGRRGEGPIRRFVARFVGQHRLEAAEGMVKRRGPLLVFVGRFLPGLRIGVNISCGAGQMAYPRFLLFDSLGATVWSAQAALLGFFLGKAFADQTWIAFVVAGIVIVIVASFVAVKERAYTKRERERVAAEKAAGGDGETSTPA